ncbi:MAG: sodium:proton antiporter [Candidatus Dormibacteraeota bacterium]|nr:sodium:proton antiporter [Candidatus Dormibacteraeota bacterium]
MSRRQRVGLFGAAAVVAAGLWCWGAWGLPGFGHYPGPYGQLINQLVVGQRHTTDAVTAVNFDYRGLDTIGEEFILFVSALGASVLLRVLRREHLRRRPVRGVAREAPQTSEAVRLAGIMLVAPGVVLGLYVVTHGQLTPGGGFQGGVILAAVGFAVFLTGRRLDLRRILPRHLSEAGHSLGAAGFVAVGLATLALGAAFLQNILPLGATAQLDSAGFIPIVSALIGLEVACALLLIASEFLLQAEEVEDQGEQRR